MTFDKFEWGEAKNRANLQKHGLDFADAEEMFRRRVLLRARRARRLRRKALDRVRDDPRPYRACGFRGAWHGHHSGYIIEKGEPP
jgi:hypothetical protein